jgi:UPF0755 protein
MIKNSKRFSGWILTLFIVVWFYFIFAYYIPHPGDDFSDDIRYVIVKKGDNLSTIASNLASLDIIISRFDFKLFATIFGKSTKMKTGRYAFERDYAISDIIRVISKGEATPYNVTIPEGYTLEEIGNLLCSEIGMDINTFNKIVNDTTPIDSLSTKATNLEGFLAPSTYNFFYEENPQTAVNKMRNHFFESLPDSFEIKASKLGLTFYEAIILASLIEEEAMVDEERPIIASVYLNRLRKRWRLECDPTVIYALGGLDRPLYRKDLEYDSPYNTYKYFGLPPGPISNPGVKSLHAAVNPSGDSYMFFVAGGDGSHIFTRNINDHINAVNRTRRERRASLQ